jgi:hypothetical protein
MTILIASGNGRCSALASSQGARIQNLTSAAPTPKLFDQVRKHGLTGILGFGERLKG